MDKIQKPSNSECYTASSEPFKFYMENIVWKSLLDYFSFWQAHKYYSLFWKNKERLMRSPCSLYVCAPAWFIFHFLCEPSRSKGKRVISSYQILLHSYRFKLHIQHKLDFALQKV
jgi:hypothetical protein